MGSSKSPSHSSTARLLVITKLEARTLKGQASPSAAVMYLATVSLESPVPEAMCRWLSPACQRRMTSISPL